MVGRKNGKLVGQRPLERRARLAALQVSVEIVNADNQIRGVGAVWDFTPLLKDGVLLPDSLSAPKDLVFQLTGIGSFREGADLHLGFVNMEAKVLGPYVVSRGGGGRGRGRGVPPGGQ